MEEKQKEKTGRGAADGIEIEETASTVEPAAEEAHEEISEIAQLSEQTEESTEADEKTVRRVSEMIRLREENKKVYRMSDGTAQAVFYAKPVHAFCEETQCFEELGALEEAENGKAAAQSGIAVQSTNQTNGAGVVRMYTWRDGQITDIAPFTVGYDDAGETSEHVVYLKLNLPTLARNPRIQKAELQLCSYFVSGKSNRQIAVNEVTGEFDVGTTSEPQFSPQIIDYEWKNKNSYTFDITRLVDEANRKGTKSIALLLSMWDEYSAMGDRVELCDASYAPKAPKLVITYTTGYGESAANCSNTYSLGRFGKSSVDLIGGNLMLQAEDFAWGGNRMPVVLRHVYQSALGDLPYTENRSVLLNAADFSAMHIGNGFRLNVMQSMKPATFQSQGKQYGGYAYLDENGNETFFKESSGRYVYGENNQCYMLYEDIDAGTMLYDPEKRTLKSGRDSYLFDAAGRLIQKTDESGNRMSVTYENGRIAVVQDGAERSFAFAYDESGYLSTVTAPDGSQIRYTYTGALLHEIGYPGGEKLTIGYTGNLPTEFVLSQDNTPLTKFVYTYSGERVASVTEYGFENGMQIAGATTAYDYSASARRTVATTTEPAESGESPEPIKTVYTFDNAWNPIGEYRYSKATGSTGVQQGQSGIQPLGGDGTAVVSTINNHLRWHNFAAAGKWSAMPENEGSFYINDCYGTNEKNALYGKTVLRMQSRTEDSTKNGVFQFSKSLSAGEYTFSVYVAVPEAFTGGAAPGVYLRVVDNLCTVIGESEHIKAKAAEYVRLSVPFKISSAQAVQVQILTNGKGVMYADAAQLEDTLCANAYNMLTNSGFEQGTHGWKKNGLIDLNCSEASFNGTWSMKIQTTPYFDPHAWQEVPVKENRATRETFTLSGWAKGSGLVQRDRGNGENEFVPQYRLRAEIEYYKSTGGEADKESYTAEFSPCTEEWQFASVQFSKAQHRSVKKLTVFCEYGYNAGTVYFDDIQLIRNSLETELEASDFGDIAEELLSGGRENEKNDVLEESSETEFAEAKDSYGNALTETDYTDGEFGTLYRSFEYNEDDATLPGNDAGNNLTRETDAKGDVTAYTVNSKTSRMEEMTDRLGNKTAYEYDANGRTGKVSTRSADGALAAEVSYAYDAFDNMTAIARGDGMQYALSYSPFHQLQSIGVRGKEIPLIRYAQKNGSGRLKQVTYANGDTMKAGYNALGQMISEKWYDATGALTAQYRYAYDRQGNLARSIDNMQSVEYTYTYENGRLTRATQSALEQDAGEIVAKRFVSSALYFYDKNGSLKKKRICPAGEEERVVFYKTPAEKKPLVSFTAGGKTVTSQSKSDSFGRHVFDELQLGTGWLFRHFSYWEGEATETHRQTEKLKSSPTTQLVKQIQFADGRTLRYTSDAEERITEVVDSVEGTTAYTYDALGQLLSETHNGVVQNAMRYDGYGNILAKNGTAYTYGDGAWKDLLTGIGAQTIRYDAQGNPTSYLGHTLTWEKGRQLKTFDGNAYIYNANGLRTGKTVNGVSYTYMLDGMKILRQSWGEGEEKKELWPLYDNEDAVCGIEYNGEPFYFLKNLQGDVIAIADKNAAVVARYTYDAWGVCQTALDITDCQIASVNPFRYRSYYFDAEIGMYYLQSRYYDPVVGRFINADTCTNVASDETVQSCNIFAYCKNSPISAKDSSGCSAEAVIEGASAGAYLMASVVPVVAAAKIGLVAAIKSALAFLWNVFVVVGLVLLVILLIITICAAAEAVMKEVRKRVKNRDLNDKSGYVVYVLSKEEGDPGTIFYVGRTKNFKKRIQQHKKTKGKFSEAVVILCKSKTSSRVAEQAVLSACIVSKVFALDKGTVPNGSNRIRGIAKENVSKFKENLGELRSLFNCTAESDMLCLMEN